MENNKDAVQIAEFPLPAYRNLSQVVSLPIEEGQCAEDLVASTVRIRPSSCMTKKPSSRLTLKSEVDYSWEDKFHGGQLVAVHITGSVLAYAISGDRQTRNGAVRIINKKGPGRDLIKNLNGPVQDIAFTSTAIPILFAIVDESASLYIHKIIPAVSSLTVELILHVVHDFKPTNNFSHLVRWVPFIPDDEKDDCENSKIVALSFGSTVEVWKVEQVASVFGSDPISPDEVAEGVMIIKEHKDTIADAVFSPDGSAVATASLDGTLQFFQLYLDTEPKCLHNWQPHGGEPISFIHFLDNYKQYSNDCQFWKFLITGGHNNTEIKVWRCANWEHTQTISLLNHTSGMKLKAAVDASSKYLLLSDQYNEVVYLFAIQVENLFAYLKSVSAYLVPFSILSFAILDVSSHYLKADDCDDDLSDFEDDEYPENVTTMFLYLMHSKSLQDCKIQIQMPKSGSELLLSTLAPDQPELPLPITLMTPKELTSPAKPLEIQADSIVLVKTEINDIATSGASSPSLEVRDIFNLQDVTEVGQLYQAEPEKVLEKIIKVEKTTPEIPPAMDWSKIILPDQTPKLIPGIFRRESLQKTKTNIEVIEETTVDEASKAEDDISKKLDEILAEIKELKLKVPKQDDTSLSGLDRSLEAHVGRINEQLVLREVADRDKQEAIMFAISQAVENLLAVKLEQVVPLEIRKNVLPAILSDFEPLKRALHVEMTQQLSVTDHLLKENISKLVNSKSVMDVLASSLTSATRNAMSGTCKELLNSFMLPRFEKLLEKTFQQVHESFTSGIRECMTLMRSDVDKVLSEMKRAENNLKHATESKKGALSQIVNQTEASLLSTADKINKQFVETIQREIKLGKLVMESSPASRAITPAYQIHERQALISQLMAAGQYNNAFQEALSASDLNMVVYICERISAEQLFTKSATSPLQQPVLLSLIQQVTADLSKNTELKCSYLTEAVLRLEPNHPTTSEHLPAVISEVERNISNYLVSHPNTKSALELNRTVMVLKILLAGKRS